MFMRQALVLTGAGTIVGVGLAFWSARLLRGFLFGVSSSDPWTMVLVPLALVVCGLLATIFPGRPAATINPVQALRTEQEWISVMPRPMHPDCQRATGGTST
jgi:ABC-type antimicrobial peptide transport system permease subunit